MINNDDDNNELEESQVIETKIPSLKLMKSLKKQKTKNGKKKLLNFTKSVTFKDQVDS